MDGKSLKTFNCPQCGSIVEIRAQGLSLSVVCSSCRSIIDSSNETYQILQKAQKVIAYKPLIPLGRRGKLFGTLWEVIGCMERADGTDTYYWTEYLLFNPTKGFAWLTEANGHWNFMHKARILPKETNSFNLRNMLNKVNYLGKDYQLYHRGTARVKFVMGEFYWRVQIGDETNVEDYIRPPEILSLEESGTEKTWSIGQYVEVADVKKNFLITEPMPMVSGVSPNQIASFHSYSEDIFKYATLFISIICFIQFYALVDANSKSDFVESFSYTSRAEPMNYTSGSFELSHQYSNLEIELSSDVDNNWIEVGVDLINDETGENREFEMGTEFYSGYDSDGRWTEGSRKNEIVISGIPKGKYHLNLQALGNRSNMSAVNFSVSITHGVLAWKNFFIFVGLLVLFPLLLWWRQRTFEMRRWADSDYSPFRSHQENS